KPIKEFKDANGRRKVKANIDIELAVDAMEMSQHIDEMVLFSGDGDFRSLVEAMQRRGVRVTVVSTIYTQPAMIADELRRQTDVFLDLNCNRGSPAIRLSGRWRTLIVPPGRIANGPRLHFEFLSAPAVCGKSGKTSGHDPPCRAHAISTG